MAQKRRTVCGAGGKDAKAAKEAAEEAKAAAEKVGDFSGHLEDHGNPHRVTAEQVEKALGECDCEEVVFCGFGEPTYRLGVMLEVCDYVHAHGKKTRLNTNGHGSIINERDIAPELVGKLDGINISLNAPDAKRYDKLCKPLYPDMAFDSMLFFAEACRSNSLNCWFSVVDCIGEAEVEECRKVAERVGVPLRVRPTIE